MPLGAGAVCEVVPLRVDHIPIDHRPLRIHGRGTCSSCRMGIVKVGTANGQDSAENDADEDAHGSLLLPNPRTHSQYGGSA